MVPRESTSGSGFVEQDASHPVFPEKWQPLNNHMNTCAQRTIIEFLLILSGLLLLLLLLLFYVFLYLCPKCSSISVKVQAPLKPERWSDNLATSASWTWYRWNWGDYVWFSNPTNKVTLLGYLAPLHLIHWLWLIEYSCSLCISQPPLQGLGRASTLSPGKWEYGC